MSPTAISTRALALVAFATVAALAGGCSTVIKPTRPDPPLAADGSPLAGVRFDGESTVLREPGMPLAPSRAWQREVQNYAATSLNTLLATQDEAPAARTIVSFDLSGPSVIQVGTWKEMTITLTSTLPDGSVIKSEPITGNIDDGFEYALTTGLGIGGTILDVTSAVAFIFLFISPSTTVLFVAVGALVGGLALNVAQSSSQYFVAASEERRWSNLFAQALTAHARDIRKGIGSAPPTRAPASPPRAPPGPLDPSEAPPPLLEPAPAR